MDSNHEPQYWSLMGNARTTKSAFAVGDLRFILTIREKRRESKSGENDFSKSAMRKAMRELRPGLVAAQTRKMRQNI